MRKRRANIFNDNYGRSFINSIKDSTTENNSYLKKSCGINHCVYGINNAAEADNLMGGICDYSNGNNNKKPESNVTSERPSVTQKSPKVSSLIQSNKTGDYRSNISKDKAGISTQRLAYLGF